VRNAQTVVQRNQTLISALAQSGVEAVSGPQGVSSPDGTIVREGAAVHSLYEEEDDWDDDDAEGPDAGAEAPMATLRTVGNTSQGALMVARYDHCPPVLADIVHS
jgi:hypothetical protein